MAKMEEFVTRLPSGIGYDWNALSYQERQGGSQTGILYAFSVLVIFLCLAALYESWPIPFSILLTLPLGAIGGAIASTLFGKPNDVYFQIGLLTTLGLTTKNAILIVQFAKDRVESGMDLLEATLEAAKLRLRPIIMTSLAFGFGVLPLALASSAGAGAQTAIGTAVLGGVVTSTFLVTIFAPLFYVLIKKTFGRDKARAEDRAAAADAAKGQ
jgi:HAE1 family hydrophobic/amphiphilic exporter-1